MAIVRIDPNSDIYKNAGTGQNFTYVPSIPTTVYSEIDDGDSAVDTDYIQITPTSGWIINNIDFIFAMSDPTPITGQIPISIDVSVRWEHNSVYAGDSLGKVALLWAGESTPPVSFDAQAYDTAGYPNYSTQVFTIPIPAAHQNWTDVNALRIAVRFSPRTTTVISQLQFSWLKGVITAAKATTVPITESADALTFSQSSDMRVDLQSVKPAGVGSVAGVGLLGAAVAGQVASKKRFQVASDSGFTTILGDTTEVAATESAGSLMQLLLSWLPSTAGTYYARMGVGTTDFPTLKWSSTQTITVGFPTSTTLTATVDGNRLTLVLTLQDTYSKPPNVTFGIDNTMLAPDTVQRSGTGPYTYTFVATAEVETGEHRVSAILGNVWTTIVLDSQIVFVPLVRYTPRIEVYQGSERVDAREVQVIERFLPDLSEASFTVQPGVHLSGDLTLKQYGGGLKIHHMMVADQQARRVSLVSTFERISKATKSVQVLTIGTSNLLAQLIAPWTLCGRTDLLTGTRELLDVEDQAGNIVVETATQCGVQLYERGGRVHVVPLTPALGEERLAVHDGDPGVTRAQRFSDIVNRIRQYYALESFPVPDNAMTNHDAAQWTGTVSDVRQTNNAIVPPSGAPWAAKITGLATHPIAFNLDDYDTIKGNFAPEALAQTLQIRLYSSDTAYWTLSRIFAGQTAAGATITGNASTDEVTQTIALSNIRLSEVTIVTTAPCQVKLALKKGGATQFESGYMNVDSQGRIIVIPDTIYKADYADQLVLTFTQLYPVGVSYGVVVANVKGKEYYSYSTGTPGADAIDWTSNGQYALSSGNVNYTGGTGPRTIHLPAVAATAVRTVPSNALVGGNRFFYRLRIFNWVDGNWVQASSSDQSAGNGTAYIQDAQLFVTAPAMDIAVNVGDLQLVTVTLYADVTVYTTKSTTVTVTLWAYRDWSYGTTYPLFDGFTIPLTGKTVGAGSPTTAIVKIGVTLTSAGIFYLDTLAVATKERRWHSIEVVDDASVAKYGERLAERKLDAVFTEASARILATGMLALGKDPAVNYTTTLPADADIELGTPVATDDGTLVIIGATTQGDWAQIQVGSPQQSLRATLAALAKKQDALQRVL